MVNTTEKGNTNKIELIQVEPEVKVKGFIPENLSKITLTSELSEIQSRIIRLKSGDKYLSLSEKDKNIVSKFELGFEKISKQELLADDEIILSGHELVEFSNTLDEDVFRYFGLGCRNVSKLFIPRDFNLDKLKNSFCQQSVFLSDSGYMDNYRYQKVLCQLNGISYIDFQNLLLIESNEIDSPIAVLYYQYYDDISLLNNVFEKFSTSIQCIVSEDKMIRNSINFGYTQQPTLYDFPDGVDVMQFILEN